ncbi:MAG: cytoplasmic protein [Thermodesulfobacteriota bacterium]|nr:cytoplasmic protein [Thermodesulfobacteriota bacterium]
MKPEVDFTVDRNNLYREESITDIKVANIRRLVPINIDGSVDESRKEMFMGHTQLMSPQGPVPIQASLDAETLGQAMDLFPDAMQKAMDRMIEEATRAHEQQVNAQNKKESRIITPGM